MESGVVSANGTTTPHGFRVRYIRATCYLNVRVDNRLMYGHNDIFRDEIREFLRVLIVLSAGD